MLSYRLAGDSGGFHDAVLRYCETINEGFPSPLNFRSEGNSKEHCPLDSEVLQRVSDE